MQYSTSSENYSSTLRSDSPSKFGNKEDKGYAYKKSSYKYSNAGNNNITSVNKSLDTNIDQLDALLEDLKNEREITKDKDILSTSANYRTMERDRIEPSGTVTKATRVIKTSQRSVPHSVQDEIDSFSASEYNTVRSNGYAGIQRDYQSNEKLYGSSKHYFLNLSYKFLKIQFFTIGNVYESNRVIDSTELIPSTSTTTTTQLEKDLQNLPLTEDILPVPGTKVTTTVRTYTYEVPATGTLSRGTPLTSSTRYNTIQRNEINSSTLQSSPHITPVVPQTVVYNTESYSTSNRSSDRPVTSNHVYEVRENREISTLHKNLPTQQPRSPQTSGTNKTIIYKVNTTENTHSGPEFNTYPQHSPDYPIQQHPPQSGPHDNYHPGPSSTRYIYKESSNIVNTIHGSPSAPSNSHPGYLPPAHPPHKPVPIGYTSSGNGYPPHGPTNASQVTYKYTSSSTTNKRRGPDSPYGSPSTTSQPAPFPVDGVEYPVKSSPPQKVDDLMQSFGQVESVDNTDLSTPRKREIETAVAAPSQHIPTVNKAGKEVYYPPGHDMMITKREEMSAGSAAGGRWAKGSGMYEYESGYKSKSKTKQGGAMVPICLPLCCAMPCSIM
ncbi:PREDICTED: nuclear pore complex protein DDB_G0274915 isoform X1 [Rhagoletis zephyria]|uniref:nuclear pore complex protein DDB_G0274915 isoform X1 n=1 Tax=Rhagoletis zephyria TaxID=28612 RepID=UPI0008112078|nr:PREDICTED: nuclear pore complex protein DDB_G0274915 isoform X1 [Rhagoletis zephyria]